MMTGDADVGADQRASYERLRAAHVHQIRAALDDHIERVSWPREKIERYRTERLRALLSYARERSPFHATRMRGFDPSNATVADLAQLPAMTKRDAQDGCDAIITSPRLRRARAEAIRAEQTWFSYTPDGEQVFSSGGSSGVRGVYVWDWSLLVTRVSTNSEPLAAEDRDAIQAAWNVPIHNLWGSTEIGVQAVGCGYGDGLHVCEDEVVLERVDASGEPVGPDQPAARTLATGLAGTTFPFIRYDLGDEVTLLRDDCPCGSALGRVADVAGRRDDDFRYGAHTVPAGVFRNVLGTDPRISEYQVRQTREGAKIAVVGTPDLTVVAAALEDALRRYGLAAPSVTVTIATTIERHPTTGKLRRFIALNQ